MNLHNFPYFDPTQKSKEKNILSFSGIPYWLRSMKKISQAHNVVFGYGFWASLEVWNVGFMKSKIVKVK